MAGEAVVGKDGADLTIEVDGGESTRGRQQQNQNSFSHGWTDATILFLCGTDV